MFPKHKIPGSSPGASAIFNDSQAMPVLADRKQVRQRKRKNRMNMIERLWRAATEPDYENWLRGFALIKSTGQDSGWVSYSYELRAYDRREKNFHAAAMQELLKWASEHFEREGVEFVVVIRSERQCDLVRREGDSSCVCMSAIEQVSEDACEDNDK